MSKFVAQIEKLLNKIDWWRNELLYKVLRKFWPRQIIPNHVTYARFVVGILISALLFVFGIDNKALIISLFAIGALSDFLDGPVARCFDKVTERGAMLDSVGDRILIIPIAIYSLMEEHLALLFALLLSEVINALVSAYYQSKKIVIESNIFAKTKMVLQSIVFFAILIWWPHSPALLFIYALWISAFVMAISVFQKIYEGLQHSK